MSIATIVSAGSAEIGKKSTNGLQKWGDVAAIAAKIHILVDCWGIPSKADYENRFVNQFDQEEDSTWDEAWMMIKACLLER